MLTTVEIPYYQSPVKAGFPSPANDYIEDRIDLNKELISHPLSTFLIRSEGDSMIDAFIPPKAKLIIDRSLKPQNGVLYWLLSMGSSRLNISERMIINAGWY